MSKVKNRKLQIKEVAQNLFREKGYKSTSMRDLASAVGIEPASLYNHIPSKAAILSEICFDIADQFFEAIDKVDKEQPIDEQFRAMIAAHIEVIVNNLDASAVFLYEWRFLDEPQLSEFILLRNKYENIFKAKINEGMFQGIFKSGNATFYSLTIFSSMNWIYDWYRPTGKYSADDLTRLLTNLLFNGIKK